jgi:hypothetical protein
MRRLADLVLFEKRERLIAPPAREASLLQQRYRAQAGLVRGGDVRVHCRDIADA